MDTLVKSPRSIVSKHIRTFTKPKPILDNAFFISLIEEIKQGIKPTVSRKEVLAAVNSGKINPNIVEDLEDTILGTMMDQAYNSGRVSREEIMKSLKR